MKCRIEGCARGGRMKRGLCNAHYIRLLRHGEPGAGRALNGSPAAHMLAHMNDDCPKWPFSRKPNGYAQINYAGNRGALVHRIVCEMAHGPPPSALHESAHGCGNGDKGCFGAKCLRWATRSENAADTINHGRSRRGDRSNFARLTSDQAVEIMALKGGMNADAKRIASKHGVTPETVQNIWSGKTWKNLPR